MKGARPPRGRHAMVRTNIAFAAEGVTLRGWLYVPPGAAPFPAVIMAHGFSAVKEHYLDRFAEAFCDAGLVALVFDNRNFGASDGEPRQEIDPWRQVRDYRHAISFARTIPEIDARRIGVWGTSYSGAHALVVGAIDRRVRCVVAQVPLVSGLDTFLRLVPGPQWPALRAAFDADRQARFSGAEPSRIPVVAAESGAACALPGRESYEFFERTAARAPAWRNEVTLRSAEMALEYEPAVYVPRVSPTPLLMVVAADDTLTPTDAALRAYGAALEPKRLELLPGGHFDAYTTAFDRAAGAAREWFAVHLS